MATTIEAARTTGEPIQLFTPEAAENPYPLYEILRRKFPVYLEPQLRTYLITRWEDVCSVLKDPKTYTSTQGVTPEQDALAKPGTLPPEQELVRRFPMLTDDPPKHNRLRRLINQAFTLRRIEELRPWMRELVDGFLDAIAPGESVEAVSSLTGPLPMTVIAHMLGVPREERDEFRQWSEDLFVESGDPSAAGMAAARMAQRFAELIVERRRDPREDLITAIVQAKLEGESLEDRTVVGFCMMLVTGGNETTTHLISNLLDIFANQPGLWSRIRDDRSLVGPAIEEALRLESPSQVMWRTTTREVELHGVTIPQGAKVGVVFASANRDPERFQEPDTFRIDRDEGEHVAFGYGVHYCLGAPLSRVEADVALNAVLDRFSRVDRGEGRAVRVGSSILRGFRHLPLRFIG